MSVTYVRSETSPQAGRDSTIPRFHTESVQDHVATQAEGRPIFVSQERVQFIQPGNPSSPVEVVTDTHRERWPKQYAEFLKGSEMAVDGTPLEQWPVVTRNQVLELKGLGIFSVEQCAGLADNAVQRIGMGGQRLRELARSYLDEADQMKITTAALDRAEKAESRIAHMELQLNQMRAAMDGMHQQMMEMKNAPNPIDAYVPADHDPLVPRYVPQAGNASSLDGLMKPRRGRPPKETQHAA